MEEAQKLWQEKIDLRNALQHIVRLIDDAGGGKLPLVVKIKEIASEALHD